MDTNRLKKFAIEARNILKAGIAAKLTSLGFDNKGRVAENLRPKLLQGGTLWNGRTLSEGFYHQWMRLYEEVQANGVNEVYEQAAYTWFNRLVAIRILQKNGLCEPVSTYADSAHTPQIVNQARQGLFPPMTTRKLLNSLLCFWWHGAMPTLSCNAALVLWRTILNCCFPPIFWRRMVLSIS